MRKGSNVLQALKRGALSVLVVGGGNWGTCIAKLAAENAARSRLFDPNVTMWLYNELYDGKPIADVINDRKENPKYLPGIPLPEHLTATSDLAKAARAADLIVIVVPHQFVRSSVAELKGNVRRDAHAISLVKGLLLEDGKPLRATTLVERELGIPCVMLSGANIANDIANGTFAETTLGYSEDDMVVAQVWQQLFDRPHFKVNAVPDIAGVEVCGAIKNVVAIAAGFCDGLGYGTNTKAAIIRVGVGEMRRFAVRWFSGILQDTFFDSAGYADVITTCFGGRNVRCAAEFVRRGGKDSWEKIEADLLDGQKMQGHLTCLEIHEVVSRAKEEAAFPLFQTVWEISFNGKPPTDLLNFIATDEPVRFRRSAECTAAAP